MINILFIMLYFLFSSNEIVYKETTGKSVAFDKCIITSENNGYKIIYSSIVDNVEQDFMGLETDSNYSARTWKFTNDKNNINITAIRKNDSIFLSGVFHGIKVEKIYEIDSSPWKELFPSDLGKSLSLNENSLSFWSISPKNLDISEFTGKLKDSNSIRIGGRNIEAYHYKIRMKGIFSIFWSADSWYRKSDMTFIKYEGVNGPPGTALTSIEIVDNKSVE